MLLKQVTHIDENHIAVLDPMVVPLSKAEADSPVLIEACVYSEASLPKHHPVVNLS